MQRLKTRAQFQEVLAGTIVAKTRHFALHCNKMAIEAASQQAEKPGGFSVLFCKRDVWMGAMVPKRWAKRAVTRNAIKRQIYTVSAEFSRLYPQAAFVVRLRASFPKAEFPSAVSEQLKLTVRTEVQALMRAGVNAV